MAREGLTWDMIAAKLNTTVKRLQTQYTPTYERGQTLFRADLHQEQLESLKTLKGHAKAQMVTWLGKQFLGQSDKVDSTIHKREKPDKKKIKAAFTNVFDTTDKPKKAKVIPIKTGDGIG